MNREKLFHETVDILVNAYNANKLEHTNCKACAVGNLITARGGVITTQFGAAWIIYTHCGGVNTDFTKRGKEQIELTGYEVDEIIKIEAAFEKHDDEDILIDSKDSIPRPNDDPNHLKGKLGLRAVYDVLLQIHEVDLTLISLPTAEEVFV